MDLKENINEIKKEISAEESFMENFFKVEKFYKKNKTLIFTIVTLLVVSTIGYYVSNYISQQNKIEANKTFNLVLANPNDTIALETLKNTANIRCCKIANDIINGRFKMSAIQK